MADGGHGTQMSMGWDMGAPIHLGGTVNGGSVKYQGVHHPSPEHSRTVHCNSSYHGLVSGGGAGAWTETSKLMVRSNNYVYLRDKSGACRRGGGVGDGDGGMEGKVRGRVNREGCREGD